MRILKYILLSLLLAFNAQAQTDFIINSFQVAAPAGGGGGSSCSNMNAVAYIASLKAQGDPVADSNNICTLFTNLTTHGLYSKIYAMADLARGNANYNKKNMISGRPDATYVGSPTHGSTGITPTLTSYINTGISPSLAAQNDIAVGLVIYDAGSNPDYMMGVNDASNSDRTALLANGANLFTAMVNSNSITSGSSVGSLAGYKGIWIASRGLSTGAGSIIVYKNGSSFSSLNSTSDPPSAKSIYINGRNNDGTFTNGYQSVIYSFWFLSSKLSGVEAAQMNLDIEAYLDGRGIGVQSGYIVLLLLAVPRRRKTKVIDLKEHKKAA